MKLSEPPKLKYPEPKNPTFGRVLTSAVNRQLLDEREEKKQEKILEKEMRKRKQLEKNSQKELKKSNILTPAKIPTRNSDCKFIISYSLNVHVHHVCFLY